MLGKYIAKTGKSDDYYEIQGYSKECPPVQIL